MIRHGIVIPLLIRAFRAGRHFIKIAYKMTVFHYKMTVFQRGRWICHFITKNNQKNMVIKWKTMVRKKYKKNFMKLGVLTGPG